MISNTFIPFSVPLLQDYLQEKYNINLNDVPIEELKGLVYNKYCKNIVNGKICMKMCKKPNMIKENEDFICSKCCEKNGIKKEPVYKLRKIKKRTNNINEDSDSGYDDSIIRKQSDTNINDFSNAIDNVIENKTNNNIYNEAKDNEYSKKERYIG